MQATFAWRALVFRGRLHRVLVIGIAQGKPGGREGALVSARCKGCSYDAECSADYTADVHTLLCANHRSLRKKQVHALTFACALLLRSCRGNTAVIEEGLAEVRRTHFHAVFVINDCGVYVRIGMFCALSPLSVKYMVCVRALSLNIVALSLNYMVCLVCVRALSLNIVVLSLCKIHGVLGVCAFCLSL